MIRALLVLSVIFSFNQSFAQEEPKVEKKHSKISDIKRPGAQAKTDQLTGEAARQLLARAVRQSKPVKEAAKRGNEFIKALTKKDLEDLGHYAETRRAADEALGKARNDENEKAYGRLVEVKEVLLKVQNDIFRRALEKAGFKILDDRDHFSDFELEAIVEKDGKTYYFEVKNHSLTLIPVKSTKLSMFREYVFNRINLADHVAPNAKWPNGKVARGNSIPSYNHSFMLHSDFTKSKQLIPDNYYIQHIYKGMDKVELEKMDSKTIAKLLKRRSDAGEFVHNDGLMAEPMHFIKDAFPGTQMEFKSYEKRLPNGGWTGDFDGARKHMLVTP